MAAALKSGAPRGAWRHGFSATAVRTPAAGTSVGGSRRALHITGAKEQSQFLAFESAVQELPRRPATPARRALNTSRALKANRDTSTIDFAYMPEAAAFDPAGRSGSGSSGGGGVAVPLLPDNYLSAALLERAHAGGAALTSAEAAAAAPVRNPEISVASLGGAVAALSEADPGGAAADQLGRAPPSPAEGEAGVVRQVLTGLLDDVLGTKAGSKAA